MRHADNPALTNSYDLIYRGVGISTVTQREHRIDVIEAQGAEKKMDVADREHYLDFF
jgi:aspartyl/asparaginyl-tRNA synthetase